ncbi:hypothetical protein PV325_003163 [Microctonus aethiopoides]|uniref:Uncharacterized protein n=1 Tax=Microctonus aethiopoides TaxID=144406 RepID=A0AA39FZF9_9HYME|nr:hypothetical protein PV325_003163 [Microctonus aethiopoides]KAK0178295.1 hypothetical protein PV328_002259 [Microctonus aethiopoides]
MDTLVETAVLYITIFTEMIQKILVTTINYGLNAIGVSPDTITELTHSITKPTDQLGFNFVEFYKQSIDSLYFDQFQILLIKIFLLTLFTILIMIYAAWYVYGSPISDKFMYSGKVMKNEESDTDDN